MWMVFIFQAGSPPPLAVFSLPCTKGHFQPTRQFAYFGTLFVAFPEIKFKSSITANASSKRRQKRHRRNERSLPAPSFQSSFFPPRPPPNCRRRLFSLLLLLFLSPHCCCFLLTPHFPPFSAMQTPSSFLFQPPNQSSSLSPSTIEKKCSEERALHHATSQK